MALAITNKTSHVLKITSRLSLQPKKTITLESSSYTPHIKNLERNGFIVVEKVYDPEPVASTKKTKSE